MIRKIGAFAPAIGVASMLAVAACAPGTVQSEIAAFNSKVKTLVDDFNGDVAGIQQGLSDVASTLQSGAVVTLQTAQKACGAASILNGFYQVAAAISPTVAATKGDEAKAMGDAEVFCSNQVTDPASAAKAAMSTVDAVKASVKQDPAIAIALQAASLPPTAVK